MTLRVRDIVKCLKFLSKFRGYEPQAVTPRTLSRWLSQFDPDDRDTAVVLLEKVIYFNRKRVVSSLVEQNRALHQQLSVAGITPEKMVYVHVDDPGSSSSVMLNLLRNRANLERLQCKFIDASNPDALIKLLRRVPDVVVIYVDDFLGSGIQFCTSRDFFAGMFPTSVPEFLVAPCVCEEAYKELSKRDVEVFAAHIHSKAERPLHPNSGILDAPAKARMLAVNDRLDPLYPLGFGGLAAMVAMFHNAPDNMPRVLRGSQDQEPFRGILPRTTDLAVPPP